ncbi:hypothetical protein OAO50_09240 [Paracoccaceae bacterium]|nr:hypothetical protein [Paracoccaceae bacterium]
MPDKKLFGKTIRLSNVDNIDTYPEDISPMFNWMQNIELPRNPTILDVGANIGLFSMSYASIFEGGRNTLLRAGTFHLQLFKAKFRN